MSRLVAALGRRPRRSAAAGSSEPVVRLEEVGRRYELGGTSVVALEGASLAVDPGEFVVVLGPSGSGKSTLLNLIGALDTPTSGRIVVAGRDITRASRRELLRVPPPGRQLHLPDVQPLPAAQRAGERAVRRRRRRPRRRGPPSSPRATLERVGLGARLRHMPHELSGGEQQRVAIARALATCNPVLLADEPTGELDFRTGVAILELLHEQTHREGTAVLVVTHNREIARIGDRVIELSSGRIVSDGPPAGGRADIGELRW